MNPASNAIKFGTDGWRAVINQDFTFHNVRICSQATADYLFASNLSEKGLLIGYDTRFASADFARAAAEIVSANGIKVKLCSRATPTPVISYGVTALETGGAIVITASHNPPQWNGFKVKSVNGASAPVEIISQIEKRANRLLKGGQIKQMPFDEALEQELVTYTDLKPLYYKQIAKLVNLEELRNSHLNMVADSMFGAGIGYFKELLSGGNITFHEINDHPDPTFPGIKQPEPITANLNSLAKEVRSRGATVGLATDGDADRLGIMDENGNFITQLQVFALLALYLLEIRKQRGAIVKTTTTTDMLYHLGELYDVPVLETPVGFKHVAPLMIKENALIGGEESGGYGFLDHVPERDAILAGLYFLDFMVKTGKTPSELVKYLYDKIGPHYYHRLDIDFLEEQRLNMVKRLEKANPDSLNGVAVAKKDTFDGFRFVLKDGSWLLVRFSGTEPLLRIYAESDSPPRVEKLLETGRDIAGI